MSSTLGHIPPGRIRLTYEDDRDLPDRSILAIPFADLRD